VIALLCSVMSDGSAGRIVEAMRTWIATAAPGAQLPSNRALMVEHSASPVTVQKAIRQLSALGLVESRPGVGTFVRAVRQARPADLSWQTAALGAPRARLSALSSTQRASVPDAIALHSGYPSKDLLPVRLVRGALARAARSEAALSRSPAAGLPELQAWFASQVAAAAPVGVPPPSARDVLVIAGSQSGLSSIFRALVGPGQPLLVESPTYWGALLAAEQASVTLVPVPTGADGPDPDDVDRAFAATGARAFYVQPTFANPTGTQWSTGTGAAVLDIARARGAFLVEDDWAHDLAIDAEPRPLVLDDDDGHVIHLRSLTKSVSPALRVAAVIARGPARDRILADRAAETMYVSGVLQAAALDVVTQPGWTTHLRGLRQQLRLRRDLLLEALQAHAPQVTVEHVPVGGLNLWVRLPDAADVQQLVGECESRGLLVAPGAEWFPAEPSGPFLRLNFSSEEPGRFAEAGRALGDALRTLA
jgi:DNA-binding transcriptional MocR family regulator